MTTPMMPEYVTKVELELRLKGITDRQANDIQALEDRLTTLERSLTDRMTIMQLTLEKNLAQYQVIASDMRTEISEIRGDVKALNARVSALESKIGWYLTLLGIGITVVIGVLQMIPK